MIPHSTNSADHPLARMSEEITPNLIFASTSYGPAGQTHRKGCEHLSHQRASSDQLPTLPSSHSISKFHDNSSQEGTRKVLVSRPSYSHHPLYCSQSRPLSSNIANPVPMPRCHWHKDIHDVPKVNEDSRMPGESPTPACHAQ